MATQIYTFKITYANCDNKIWRTAAVSSNYTLAKLGYLILASFDTAAYHLFDIKYKDATYLLDGELFEDFPFTGMGKYGLLGDTKLGKLGMCIGDVMEMTYDQGCCQEFEIVLLEISDMPLHKGNSYPKILDGAGRGIVEDLSDHELLDVIKKIDQGRRSGINYLSPRSHLKWDYRDYRVEYDNARLKGDIERIRYMYEEYDEDDDEDDEFTFDE